MALKQTWGWKFDPDLDYMTGAERSHFKELVQAGVITIFRIGTCGNKKCEKDIPGNKTFCSKDCKESVEVSNEKDV